MLKEGDAIRCVTPIGEYNQLQNMEFTIVGIQKGVISIKSNLGIGIMSEDEFKKYFVLIRKWTPWIHSTDFYKYKTDNRKYVKVEKNGIKAKASCHPNDEFDLDTGIETCLEKIALKTNEV